MICTSSDDSAKKYNGYYIISACSYACEGVAALFMHEGAMPKRIFCDSETLSGDELLSLPKSGSLCVFVYLRGTVDTILSALKKAADIICDTRLNVSVYILSDFPAAWVSFIISPLINNEALLSNVFCTDANLSCERILTQEFIRIASALSTTVKYKNRKIKKLSLMELTIVIHYYRGESVKNFSRKFGIPIKSVYFHRKKGLAKLTALNHWLNNADAVPDHKKRAIKHR